MEVVILAKRREYYKETFKEDLYEAKRRAALAVRASADGVEPGVFVGVSAEREGRPGGGWSTGGLSDNDFGVYDTAAADAATRQQNV